MPADKLQALVLGYPSIRDRLWQQAQLWDLLVLCHQQLPLPRNTTGKGIFQALSLFTPHRLSPGKFTTELLQYSPLWLVHKGELISQHGKSFTSGSVYSSTEDNDYQYWQVVKLT